MSAVTIVPMLRPLTRTKGSGSSNVAGTYHLKIQQLFLAIRSLHLVLGAFPRMENTFAAKQ